MSNKKDTLEKLLETLDEQGRKFSEDKYFSEWELEDYLCSPVDTINNVFDWIFDND